MPLIFKPIGFNFTRALRNSFRARLFTGVTTIILVVSAAFAGLLFSHQYRAQLDKRYSEGNLMAKLLARDVRLAVFSGDREEIVKATRGAMSLPDVQSVEIYDRDGLLLARQATAMSDDVKYNDFIALIPGLINIGLEKSLLVGKQWDSNPEAAIGSVRISLDESKYESQLRQLILTAAISTFLFLLLGIAAAYLFAESMTRPLAALAAGTAALKDGNDNIRVPVETSDEIGQLARMFNSMVEAIRGRTRDLEEALEELYNLNVGLENKVAQRTTQLESANRELESFNYSASHDLRAPLNRLAGFCDALREEYGDRLDEQGHHYLDRIAATGEQMDNVLSAMLTLYQIQQRSMTPRSLDISELVHAVAASLKQRENDRQVNFIIQENVTVYGDMKLIWLALENLIGNAWKFTKGKTDATIEFGETFKDGSKVCFIRDNGAGFEMTYYNKLFTPFQRLHNHEDFPGTGVGLAIVQRIIARHNGRIWLESVEKVGTTCYFTLPEISADAPGKEGGNL